MVSKILPEWDRHDKFVFLNSTYRLAYFTHWQMKILIYVIGPLTLLPPLLEAQFNVETGIGYLTTSIIMTGILLIISKYYEGFLLDQLRVRKKDMPHIKAANVKLNLSLILVTILLFWTYAFGMDVVGIVQGGILEDNLLHSEANYGGIDELVSSTGATILYSVLVLIAVSSLLRAVCVGYYRFVL